VGASGSWTEDERTKVNDRIEKRIEEHLEKALEKEMSEEELQALTSKVKTIRGLADPA